MSSGCAVLQLSCGRPGHLVLTSSISPPPAPPPFPPHSPFLLLRRIPPSPSLAPFPRISLTTAHPPPPPPPFFISQSSGDINRGNNLHWGVYLVVCVLLSVCFRSNDPQRLTGGTSGCVALGFTDPGHHFSTPLQPSKSKTHCMLHSVRPSTQEAFRVHRLIWSRHNNPPEVRNKSPHFTKTPHFRLPSSCNLVSLFS